MKRYTVALVRKRLADALDEAERGTTVIIERKGVRYRLAVEASTPRPRSGRPRVTVLDPSVESGRWGWTPTARGLAFRAKRK